jgi:hypothetical protein
MSLPPVCADGHGGAMADPPIWCRDKWCYVEPNCSVSDTRKSHYFGGSETAPLRYSYANCETESTRRGRRICQPVSPVAATGYALLRVATDVAVAEAARFEQRCSERACYLAFKCGIKCQERRGRPPAIREVVIFNMSSWYEASSREYISPLVGCTDTHASGFMCQKCARDYWSFGNSCRQCPWLAKHQTLSVLLWALFTFGFFAFLRRTSRILPKLLIIIPFLQICVVLSKLELEWKGWGSVLASFSIVNFNYDLTLHQCNGTDVSYAFLWVLYVTLPFMWIWVDVVQLLIIETVSRLKRFVPLHVSYHLRRVPLPVWTTSTSKSSIIDGFNFILKATWIPCTTNSIAIFDCARFQPPFSDTMYLRASPELLCYEGTHLYLSMLGGVCLR